LTGNGEPEQLRAALVTANFFDVLGARPALGRTFRTGDSADGALPTILLGWELFERRFGGDASIVGRTIDVNDSQATVIAVLPKAFPPLPPAAASAPDGLQAYVPFWPDMESGPRGTLFLRVIGRMRPGVTFAQARSDISSVAGQIEKEIGRARLFTAHPL